jgi:hypothetical protein
MTIDDLRERARQMCELGHLVSDERARLEAQLLAAHYSQMADALAATVCPRSSTIAMNGSRSSMRIMLDIPLFQRLYRGDIAAQRQKSDPIGAVNADD